MTAVQEGHVEHLLFGRPFQLVEGLRQFVLQEDAHKGLGLGFEVLTHHTTLSLLGFEFGWQRRLHHVAYRTEVIV